MSEQNLLRKLMRNKLVLPTTALLVFAIIKLFGDGSALKINGAIIIGIATEVFEGTTAGRQALVCSALYGPMTSIFGATISLFSMDALIISRLVSMILLLIVVALSVSSVLWIILGRTRDLIILAFSVAMAILCGSALWTWALLGAVSILAGALLSQIYRKRLPAVLILGLLPAVYATLAWCLMSWLVMSDPFYFLRPFERFSQNIDHLFHPSLHRGGSFNKCDICVNKSNFNTDSTTDKEVIAAVETYIQPHLPHCTVFVTDFTGLGLLHGDKRRGIFVPVMDMHIGMTRRDYHDQSLFILVHSPDGHRRLESMSWKAPDFFDYGSSRTLLALDLTDWRLYEITKYTSADTNNSETDSKSEYIKQKKESKY